MSIQKHWDKVDPRDAELLAIKTQVTNLEKKHTATHAAPTTDSKKNKKAIKEPHLSWDKVEGTKLFKWRTVKQGDTVKAGGRMNYWCKNHKFNGKWDGLCIWHKTEDCRPSETTAKEGKDKYTSNRSGNLQLKSNLKTVLISNLCLSSGDAEKIFSRAQAQEN